MTFTKQEFARQVRETQRHIENLLWIGEVQEAREQEEYLQWLVDNTTIIG